MAKELKTLTVVRKLAAEFRKTGNLERLLREVSEWSFYFGRFRHDNSELFLNLLGKEMENILKKRNHPC